MTLPYRGDGSGRPDHLPLPPGRMPTLHRGRPLKRWRYVGVYGPTHLMCAGLVNVGGVPQAFWAVWDRQTRQLHERTTKVRTAHVKLDDGRMRVDDGDVHLDLTITPDGDALEVVSQHGPGHIWTRKLPITATGTATLNGVETRIEARGLVDDSAGYHARRTDWRWSAGVGTTTDGRRVTWNLVTGLHDAPTSSERAVWVDGVATEPGPVTFAADLSAVDFAEGTRLRFAQESVRAARENLLVVASDYEQPFGLVSGTLPDGVELAEGYGVMERHSARW